MILFAINSKEVVYSDGIDMAIGIMADCDFYLDKAP